MHKQVNPHQIFNNEIFQFKSLRPMNMIIVPSATSISKYFIWKMGKKNTPPLECIINSWRKEANILHQQNVRKFTGT